MDTFKIKYNNDSIPDGYSSCRIYIRPSKYSLSIEHQELEIIEECDKRNLFIVGTYIDYNESFSSDLNMSPALNKLIGDYYKESPSTNSKDIKSKETLVVFSLDRLFRDSLASYWLIKNLIHFGINLLDISIEFMLKSVKYNYLNTDPDAFLTYHTITIIDTSELKIKYD